MITLGANGYVTIGSFKAWATARCYDVSNYNDLQIAAAITVSSVDFIDANYEFMGSKVDESQPMLLPTNCVSVADIENAASQAAYLQLTGALFVAPEASTNGDIESESRTLGRLSTSTTYASGTSVSYVNNKTRIDRMLKDFVSGSAGGLGVRRGAL